MILIPWLLGRSSYFALYRKKVPLGEGLLIGWMIYIGLAEVTHLFGVFLGRSFSACIKLFLAMDSILLILALLILFFAKKKNKKKPAIFETGERKLSIGDGFGQQATFFLKCALWFGLIFYVALPGARYHVGNPTLEMVQSTLHTDHILGVNPLTGLNYQLGTPLRIRILCMPTFYSIISKVFSIDAGTLINQVAAAFVVAASFMAYHSLARALFEKDALRKNLFMIVVALLVPISSGLYGLDGFGLLRCGAAPTTIRNTVLIPFVFSMMIQKKYKLVVLCILVEACMVWTLYGLGSCTFIAVAMALISWILSNGKKLFGKSFAGKEEP